MSSELAPPEKGTDKHLWETKAAVSVACFKFLPCYFGLVMAALVAAIPSGFGQTERSSSIGARTIELYAYNGQYALNAIPAGERPVLLEVPEGFGYGSTEGAARTWGVQILTYYPSFTSPQDPANKDYGLECVGICNGRILISVEYRPGLLRTASPNKGDFIARAELHWKRTPPYPPNVTVRDLGSQDGFDSGFERITVGSSNEEIVLFRNAADGAHYDLTATCHSGQPKVSCILHLSLSCNPAIYVSVNGLDGSYLDRSSDIARLVNDFVGAMVKVPNCRS